MSERKCQIRPGDRTPVHPWYKERLRTKCLKDPVQKLQLSGALNGHRWRFLTAGLDDFRDGYPVPEAGTFTQPQRRTEAVIFGLSPTSQKSPKRRFTKEQACFSKQNCLQKTRRQFVDAVEQSLSAHPLALYPHLGSGMAPELFEDVLSVLDPAMHVRTETPVAKENLKPCDGLNQDALEQPTKLPNSPVSRQDKVQTPISRNPYKLREAKEIEAKKDRTISDKSFHSTSPGEEVNTVTKLFCDWVASLGEETNDITEFTILNMFASSCEKKPILTFQDVGTNEKPEELSKDYSQNLQLKDRELNKVCTPSKKTRCMVYGAWYLNPKTWKKRPANEPLRDPSVTEDSELEQQSNEKDEELKQTHGAQAFRQFVITKGLRVPRFLSALFSEEEQENRTRGLEATASTMTRSENAVL
ncbi:protein FAM47E isoform 1-T1 [Clarias gariepinus]